MHTYSTLGDNVPFETHQSNMTFLSDVSSFGVLAS